MSVRMVSEASNIEFHNRDHVRNLPMLIIRCAMSWFSVTGQPIVRKGCRNNSNG